MWLCDAGRGNLLDLDEAGWCTKPFANRSTLRRRQVEIEDGPGRIQLLDRREVGRPCHRRLQVHMRPGAEHGFQDLRLRIVSQGVSDRRAGFERHEAQVEKPGHVVLSRRPGLGSEHREQCFDPLPVGIRDETV